MMEIGNQISILLSFAGGLALFLFGMNVMGDALRSMTGGRTREWIARLCSTPLRGVLLGAAVTALVQSSSATTVMVIGFVNSGLMTLSQSVGVIMGANLGTTITSWLLALTNVGGSGFFRLFDPEFFSPLLGLCGLFLITRRGTGSRRQLGYAFLGFFVLIFGLETMSGAVKPLAEVPEFVSLLTAFSRPVPGFLAGVLLTALIQSSSASVGILGALASTGAVSVGATVPIILGQNVGTCVTTLLSGVGASVNARRAGFLHLYFNLIGAAVQLAAFLTVDGFLSPAIFDAPADITTIAVVHTLFNVISLVLMLPFPALLEKLAVLSVPDGRKKQDGGRIPARFEGCTLLDERFLALPAFALTMCRAAAGRMAELCLGALTELEAELSGNSDRTGQIAEAAQLTDGYYSGLNGYLARLAAGKVRLRGAETRQITRLLAISAELYRIGELTREAAAPALRANGAEGQADAARLCRDVRELLTGAVAEDGHGGRAEGVLSLAGDSRRERLDALRSGQLAPEAAAALDEVTVSIEHIARHAERLALLFAEK